MKKINIGLDLGIASVGWAVVNAEEFEIIDAGVRLFSEANRKRENTASTRREKRLVRRMKRRRQLRSNDLKRLFVKYGMLKNTSDFSKILNQRFQTLTELKCYALESPIKLEEMMLILFSTLKKRGSFNLKEDYLEDEKNQDLSAEELEKLIAKRDQLLPCLIQLENLKIKNKVIGSDNKFSHEMYKKEILKIIESQKQFGFFTLDEKFIEEYFKIFDRKREYFEGPNDPSPFSWGGDEEEFYKRLIGQDTFARDENRTAKKGMYANLFNLLNDLNQIEIKDPNRKERKVTKYEKQLLVKGLFKNLPSKNKNLTLKVLAKFLEVDEKNISGYRVDKDNKANFTKFEGLNDLYNRLKKSNLDTSWLVYENLALIDEILNLLTKYQSINSSKVALMKLFNEHHFNDAEKMSDVISVLTKNYNGSHALSNKTILRVLPFLWDEPKMFQRICIEQGIEKEYKFQFDDSVKYIPILKEEINNLFISPVVKRSLLQALKVLKALQIQYRDYHIETLVIEMMRERNSEDFRKSLIKSQRTNEKINQEINNFILMERGIFTPTLHQKIYLAMEQDFKCPYCFRPIEINHLVHRETAYEIDYIIPRSISLNNRKENLVVAHQEENHEKGDSTAYQYINSPKSKMSWAQFVAHIDGMYAASTIINKNSKYLRIKKESLFLDTNFNDPDQRWNFISNSLNDVRYSTSEIRTYLEEFQKNNTSRYNDYSLKTLNWRSTSFIRKEVFNIPERNRDDYRFYGIDAITIAYSNLISQQIFENKSTKQAKEQYAKYAQEIQNFDFKFSKKMNRNYNKQLTNDTLYAFAKHEGEFKQINKVSLFSDNMKTLDKIFLGGEITTLLGLYNPKTFAYLKDIYQRYPKGMKYLDEDKEMVVKNPFVYFTKVLKQTIRIQKDHEGTKPHPEVKMIRYYGNKMGKILDVSHKYPVDTEKKKVGFTNFKPIRIDLYQHKITKKYKVFPVNAAVISKIDEKEIIINQEKYNKLIEDVGYGYKISLKEYNKVMELFPRGNLIRITSVDGTYDKEIVELVGSPNPGVIEIDYYNRKKDKDEGQLVISVGQLVSIEKVHLNVLGTKMKIVKH